MNTYSFLSPQTAAGGLLILSGIIFCAGGMLYTGRAIWRWPAAASPAYLYWERGFVIAALLTAVAGFHLLEKMLETASKSILAPTGMMFFLLGAGIGLFAEAFFLSKQEWLYAPIVIFVVLAFLAQAFFGAALLRTDLLPAWVGWASILWNLGWLVVLPIARPRDIYYPWLHYAAPILIGIMLLING
jgi:hypothetical protein